MKKIGIFYGSSNGTTESIAQQIAGKLSVAPTDIYDVSKTPANQTTGYDVLLLGSSTWGAGDLQDDWYDFLENLKQENLSGKTVALFGCGDSASFSDTFCDAMGTIYDELQNSGCRFAGSVDTAGYCYDSSTAERDGHLIGLALDEMNESDQTEERIDQWIESLQKDGAL